jgi:hypothetical protein
MYDYTERHEANELSRSKASAHRELWEAYEIELLEEGWADDESTLPEIAELLGRTIEACRQKHYDIRKAPERRAAEGRRKSQRNSTWDRGWTSLEDMGF